MKEKIIQDRRGTTLLELLTVISIIGLLATGATVSYGTARQYSRDIKRVNEIGVVQTALELYNQQNNSYPIDQSPGSGGLLLGYPETSSLGDNGFTDTPEGILYLLRVPLNPKPGGVDYIYRSLNVDGTDCDAVPCARYAITFAVEGRTAQLEPGVHTIGSEGGLEISGETLVDVLPDVDSSFAAVAAGGASRATFFFKEKTAAVVDNPKVEIGASRIIAPVVTGAVVLNVASSIPLVHLPHYLLFYFSQPILYVFRPRRRTFGVVYHSLSKLPIDLAIVRLRHANGAIFRSVVTDVHGRFQFIVPKGRYRVEVTKPGFKFPTEVLRNVREDAGYLDLYHGETIRVDSDGTSITPNIPMDPGGIARTDKQIRLSEITRKIKHAVAVSGIVLTAMSFIAVPSIWLGSLVIVHVGLYFFFRRIAVPHVPRKWGIVYEEGVGKPVPQAVLRMFSLPYHKMIDSQVADVRGRYHFLVGPAKFYITVTKDGYTKTETGTIDLTKAEEPTVIHSDIPMRKGSS